MKRYFYKSAADGKIRFITMTARKANYSDLIFGKFTLWPSKKEYDNGDCADAITFTNIYLGSLEADILMYAEKFMEAVLKEADIKMSAEKFMEAVGYGFFKPGGLKTQKEEEKMDDLQAKS